MAMGAGEGRGARSGINVTPLIDVLLVLLIIFMVIQPTAQHGLDALAPQPARLHDTAPDPRTLVVSVAGAATEATYRLNGQPLTLAELQPELQRVVMASGRHVIFVQGSPDLDYGAVAPVFNAAHGAGAGDVGVLTPSTLAGR